MINQLTDDDVCTWHEQMESNLEMMVDLSKE